MKLTDYLGDKPFWKVTVRLAVPVALQNVLTSSFQLVDTLMVSRLGDVTLSAVGMAAQWGWMAGLLSFGLCSGMAFSGQALFDGTPIPGALIDVARLDPAIKPNVAQPEDPNAPPQDDKAQPKAKKQDKQPTPQPISAFGATQQVKADGQGVFTFVCPLPGWWAFSTSMAGDPLQDPEGKQKPLEIKTIFWVYMNDCPKTAPSKK